MVLHVRMNGTNRGNQSSANRRRYGCFKGQILLAHFHHNLELFSIGGAPFAGVGNFMIDTLRACKCYIQLKLCKCLQSNFSFQSKVIAAGKMCFPIVAFATLSFSHRHLCPGKGCVSGRGCCSARRRLNAKSEVKQRSCTIFSFA